MDRRAFVAGTLAAGAFPAGAFAAVPKGKPEKASLRAGTAVDAMSFLPVYVAAARTWKEQGLDVELVSFRGDAEISQALAGGSIDVSFQSLNGLINLISSGQPVTAVYAGFDQADFCWVSQKDVKQWSDLRGKTLGVATYGSLTDALSRYVLQQHKLEPGKDVQIVQAGSTPSTYQALKSGRLAAGILSPPFWWEATGEGFNLLGTESRDVAKEWPKHLVIAKKSFVDANPNTITALLRAHVAAIRLARRDRNVAVDVMIDRLKLSKPNAQKAYDVVMPFYDERGRLPEKYMPTFWKITKSLGDVKEPWPSGKFLDPRWIDSFKDWAP